MIFVIYDSLVKASNSSVVLTICGSLCKASNSRVILAMCDSLLKASNSRVIFAICDSLVKAPSSNSRKILPICDSLLIVETSAWQQRSNVGSDLGSVFDSRRSNFQVGWLVTIERKSKQSNQNHTFYLLNKIT